MAFSNYAELKVSIVAWGQRDDLGPLIDDFILLAEKDMFRSNDNHEALDIRDIEITSTAAITTKEIALPDGYLSMRAIGLLVDNGNQEIRFAAPDSMVNRTGTGRPSFCTVTNQLEFDVTPDQSYTIEMKYFRRPTPLSTDNPVNIILTDNPDIYLFGALSFLFAHAVDEERAAFYYNAFSQAIEGSNQEDKQGRYGPAPAARIEGPTP